MKLRELFEQQRKVAVAAFGRMNPPTIGHEKLVDKVKSIDGDHYIFLSQTQKPKTDPLPFDVKLEFAKKFFPGVNVGHPTVRTPIQMLQMLEQLGYTDVVYVAGSDRVESFTKLFNDYNGKEYNFDSIQVVSAGERDPDADGAEGMSASKMRAAAASGDYESFATGTPKPQLAQKMYDAVRTGMGIKAVEPAEDVAEGFFGLSSKEKGHVMNIASDVSDIPGNWDFRRGNWSERGLVELKAALKYNPEYFKYALKLGADDYEAEGVAEGSEIKIPTEDGITMQDIRLMAGEGPLTKKTVLQAIAVIRKQRKEQGVREASYEGNIGIMELFKFFAKTEKEDPKLVARVKEMIKQRRDKEVWRIIQDYTGTQLTGKEFEGSIKEAIFREAGYGKYWCSTDKKWKYRQGPKQSRSS